MARNLPYSPRVFAVAGNVLRDPALLRAFVAIWRLPVINLRVRRPDFDAWSDFLALDLGCSGVRHLLVGSALREPAGNQYFQHLLGYRARNLRVAIT